MGDMDLETLKASFEEELLEILPDLYNFNLLARSQLVRLFGLQEQSDAPLALQHILLNAIEALRPDSSVPPGSKAWRFFNILHYRYKEQYTQRQVANDLSLSVRQVRRQEKTAQRILVDYLWTHHHLEQEEGRSLAAGGAPSQEQELAWLEKSIPSKLIDLRELIQAVLDTARPHTQALRVSVTCDIPDNLSLVSMQHTSVRQAILHIITTAAQYALEGQIAIVAKTLAQREGVRVQIEAHPNASSAISENSTENLEVAQKLIDISGGSLEVTIEGEADVPFAASVTLPLAKQIPILVADDNADTLALMERYLSGSRYHFIGTSDPREVLSLAEERNPGVIVLDVMLPGIDGWELLGRLREHPNVGTVPVIVCTILPQDRFARTLGAADFIRKPVSREVLLAALDRGVEKPD
jgi:CheY-like chemotaxis protein